MKKYFQKLIMAFLLFGSYSTTHPNILFHALKNGNVRLAKTILNQVKNGKRQLDINAKDQYGNTALHKIILNTEYRSNISLIKLVLQCEANINARDRFGITLLHITCNYEDSSNIIQFLLDNGAQINAKTQDTDVTPLHLAAQEGHLKNVQVLIRNNANTEAQDYRGCTPMLNAAGAHKIAIVQFLMKYTRDIPNNDGVTVRRIMEEKNYGNLDQLVFFVRKIGPNKQHVALLGTSKKEESFDWAGITTYHICGRILASFNHFKKIVTLKTLDEANDKTLIETIANSIPSVSNKAKQTILAYACNGPNCDKLVKTGPSSNSKCLCRKALYCSTACQKNHWPQHKTLHRRYMILQSGCAMCKKQQSQTPRLRLCSGCKKVAYCSAQCQKNDWKYHKPNCHQ